MALTDNGLIIPRLTEIKAANEEKLRELLGVGVDVSETSVAGVLLSILSLGMSDVYELSQGIYDARDIYKATGLQLDILASYLGTSRIGAGKTSGTASLTGDNGTVIPAGVVVETVPQKDRFSNPSRGRISNLNASDVDLEIGLVQDSTDYNITIDGTTYTHNSGVGATATNIVDGLITALGSNESYLVSRVNNTITIRAAIDGVYSFLTERTITTTTNITFTSVTSPIAFVALEDGAISGIKDSLTNIKTPVAGWNSVNNNTDFVPGRLIETDEEFRQRLIDTKSRTSTSTVDAIATAVQEIQDVASVNIIENTTMVDDVDGRPPKSFDTIVVGGTDPAVAQAIWDTKPAGIATTGNTNETAYDLQGNPQTISFTRPAPKYIWVDVEYTLYDEEVFPVNGHQTIKDIVYQEGIKLGAGNEVIARRFIGAIYAGVSGLEDVVVKVGFTANDTDPKPALAETTIDVTISEFPEFATARIDAVDLTV